MSLRDSHFLPKDTEVDEGAWRAWRFGQALRRIDHKLTWRLPTVLRQASFHTVVRIGSLASPGPTPKLTFVLSTPRTGSTLLATYLDSLPGSTFIGEPLDSRTSCGLSRRQQNPGDAQRYLERLTRAFGGDHFGVKLHAGQLAAVGLTVRALENLFPAARFILMYRRSLIDQYVSMKVAEVTGAFAATDRSRRPPEDVGLDADDALAFAERTLRDYRYLELSQEAADRCLILCYEDLVADPTGVLSKLVAPFLRMPATSTMRSGLKKQASVPSPERARFEEQLRARPGTARLFQDFNPIRADKVSDSEIHLN